MILQKHLASFIVVVLGISFLTTGVAHAQNPNLSLNFTNANLNQQSTFYVPLNSTVSVFAVIQNNTSTSAGNAQTYTLNGYTDNVPSTSDVTVTDNFFPNFGGTQLAPGQSTNGSGSLFDVQAGGQTGTFHGSYSVNYSDSGNNSFSSPVYNYTIVVENPPPVPEASSVIGLLSLGGIACVSTRRRRSQIR